MDGYLVAFSGADDYLVYRYLCEMYDSSSRLIPKDIRARTKVREWMASAEGTYILHAVTVSCFQLLLNIFSALSVLPDSGWKWSHGG